MKSCSTVNDSNKSVSTIPSEQKQLRDCCQEVCLCAACPSAICRSFCDVHLTVCVWLKVHGTECASREQSCSLNNVQTISWRQVIQVKWYSISVFCLVLIFFFFFLNDLIYKLRQYVFTIISAIFNFMLTRFNSFFKSV